MISGSDVDIAQRLGFLGFRDGDMARLRAMAPKAQAVAGEFVDQLYAHLERFAVTRRLLGDSATLERLKRSQLAYFGELFTRERDADYVARRVKIGAAHHRVRLPPQFYLGTYCRYLCELAPMLSLHGSIEDQIADWAALLKAVFFDAGLVLEAYFQRLTAEKMAQQHVHVEEALAVPGSLRAGAGAARATGAAEPIRTSVLLDDGELRTRRAFIGLDDSGESLRAVAAPIRAALPGMLDEFYQRILAEPELASTLAGPGVIERLRAAQEVHWEQLLVGPYDLSFAADRLAVGRTHERIDLAPHWYLGGVCLQLCGLLPAAIPAGARSTALPSELIRAVFFDLTFVLDAYMQARLEHLLNLDGYATSLVARMPTAVLVIDLEQRIVASNRRALDVLQCEGGLLLGARFSDILPGRSQSEALSRASRTGEPVTNILVDLSGAWGQQAMRMSIVPLQAQGSKRGWVAVMLDDISEIREHDTSVRHKTGWLEQLVQGAPGLIWQVAPESGRVEAIAGRVKELTGLTESAWLQQPGGIGARVPLPDRGHWEGSLRALRSPGDTVDVEHDLAVPGDQIARFRSTVRLAADESGRLVWRGISSDISEETRLRGELGRQLSDQREIARFAAMAVETAELVELYASACATLHRMLACDGVLLMERGPDSEARLRAVSERGVVDMAAATAQFPQVVSAAVVAADDPVFAMDLVRARRAARVVVAPVPDAQPHVLLLAYWRTESAGGVDDIPKMETVAGLVGAACQRQAEHRRQIMHGRRAALGSLAAGVAHDFNNVLAAQLASLDVLREVVGSDPEAAELIDGLYECTEHGRDLVSQVLAFARPAGKRPEVDLDEIARKAVQQAETARGRRIGIDSEIGSAATVRAEPSQLRRVIVNLLDNAIQASQPGQRVSIQVRREELETTRWTDSGMLLPGVYAVVRVADRGHGMPADVRERVFEPFFTTKSETGGSGLGLAIVHTAVTTLGGAVSIASRTGGGTCIEVWLPVAATDRSRVPDQASTSARGEPAVVLLVEDSATARRAQKEFLESAGYSVIARGDGSSALQALRAHERVDILIADVSLPGMDGFELIECARAVHPSIRVVVVTGGDHPAAGEICLRKPFPLSALVATIESALSDA